MFPSSFFALASRGLAVLADRRRFGAFKFILFAVVAISNVTCAGSSWAKEPPSEPEPEHLQFFETQVRPLLAKRCFSCHGDKKQESDLRLDTRATILAGGASGDPAAVVGDPNESLIVQYARGDVEGMEMPPDKPLSEAEVATLQRWVELGLPWPAGQVAAVETMDERFDDHQESHWAFQPVQVVRPSRRSWPSELRAWPRTRIDEFVVDGLHLNQMRPSPEADARTLIRRVTFDLLGLPPTPKETADFVTHAGLNGSNLSLAYEQLVERLLASPAYGERWGRHWLDVARYADTRGYTFGGADRNYAWSYTYRDYVIDAFNRDLPYDTFVVQQLAADKLDLGDDNLALAALGFLTVGRKFNNKHDDIDDLIDAVTRGFVGLTVACARCHDHKYDAIPTEDYYSLYGVFNSSRESGPPLIGDAETLPIARAYEERFNLANGKLQEFDRKLKDQITDEAHTKITDYLVAAITDTTPEGLRPELIKGWKSLVRRKAKPDSPTLMPWHRLAKVEEAQLKSASLQLVGEIQDDAGSFLNPTLRTALIANPPTTKQELATLFGNVLTDAYEIWKNAGGNDAARRKQSAEVRQLLWYFFDPNSPATIDDGKVKRYLSREERDHRDALQRDMDVVRKTQPVAYHRAMVVTDKGTPSNARVFIRGNAARRGDKVPRQAPRLLAKVQQPYEEGSGRLELAQEIANPENPLTARVIANRIWMHHFGKPLVVTPSDFGIRCDRPKQHRLLDHLADLLMQSDWSLKSLHREILLSATYRQSSGDRPECYAVDPGNDWLWRMNRKRLDFEAMRDALLFASENLDREMGGKPVRQFRDLQNGSRRSVYGYIDRQDLPNLLRVFDFAGPDASSEQRADTTVPQQALFMLNSPFVIEQAKSLVSRLASQDTRDAKNGAFVDALYQRIFSRAPSTAERQIALDFLDSDADVGAQLDPREQLAQLLLLTNEFCYVD